MVMYSSYWDPIKLQTEVMGIPEAVKKLVDKSSPELHGWKLETNQGAHLVCGFDCVSTTLLA